MSNSSTAPVAKITDVKTTPIVKTAEQTEIETLKAQIAQLEADKAAKQRKLKGQLVTFKNQKGEVIKGYGVLYYVARMNGKLFYKEASQVTILPNEPITPTS